MKIPDAYLKKIDLLVLDARSLLEKGERLAALAFIGSLTRDDMLSVVVDDSSEESKDKSASMIQAVASARQADFIFMVREAWRLPQKYVARYQEIIDKYGSVGASPHKEDIVAFSLETTHGTWIAMPLIKAKPPSKKRRTIGLVEFTHMPEIQGRFTGLLPAKMNEGGTLH